ncbi:MAG: HD domain-containing protein [Ruminococcaceae bacterium]|nr:HD domain-containing protein [Oscillospiraceae bacterium]
MTTYQEIRENREIKTYILSADESLRALGYTEHSLAHVTRVAEDTGRLLTELGANARLAELGRIAGYLHDIGNLVNRTAHSISGAVMAFELLSRLQFPAEELAMITTAIGNHDEGTGVPVSDLAAALILADKSDVRRSRVRNPQEVAFDIHDRVNYAAVSSELLVEREAGEIILRLKVDTEISPLMEYFEIFLNRMTLCRQAAERLGQRFRLQINGQLLA